METGPTNERAPAGNDAGEAARQNGHRALGYHVAVAFGCVAVAAAIAFALALRTPLEPPAEEPLSPYRCG